MTSLSSLGYMRKCVFQFYWSTSIPQSEGTNSTELILDSCSELLLDQYCLYKGSDLSVMALLTNGPSSGAGGRLSVGHFLLKYLINELQKVPPPSLFCSQLSGNWWGLSHIAQNKNFDSKGLSWLEHCPVYLILFSTLFPCSLQPCLSFWACGSCTL